MEIKDAQKPTIEKIKEMQKKVIENGTLFYGDSIIEFWNIDNVDINNKYNAGIRQSSSQNLLDFADMIVPPFKAKNLVFLAGANDLSDANQFTHEQIITNIKKMIELAHNQYGIKNIFVILPLPIDETRMEQKCRNNKQLKLLDEQLAQALKEYSYVTSIDCFDELLDNNQLKADYTIDGIHLNDNGTKVLADKLAPVLKKVAD